MSSSKPGQEKGGSTEIVWDSVQSNELLQHPLSRRPKKNTLSTPEALRRCKFQLKFCDENRNSKSQFTKDDRIYVQVKVTNPTQDTDISIGMPYGIYLGKWGLVVRMDGLEPGRVDFSKLGWLELGASKSYTFFKVFTKPKKDQDVAYGTPATGKYTARVWVAGKPVVDDNAISSFSVA